MKIKINQCCFEVDPKEHQEYWKLIHSGKWEGETFNAIDQFIEPNDIAIDIGAWAGPISFYMANKLSKVYSIEPDPVVFQDLARNCQLNSNLQVNPFQLAIANKTQKLNLFARKKYGQSSSSLLHRSHDNVDSETVQAYTLADFVSNEYIQKVHFIKIDTEGGEFLFLKQWAAILKKLDYPTLLVSFHVNQLEESLFYKKFKSKILAKTLLKISRNFSLAILKKQVSKELQEINLVLKVYQNTYALNEQKIKFEQLIQSPKLVGNNSFIFSNKDWKP